MRSPFTEADNSICRTAISHLSATVGSFGSGSPFSAASHWANSQGFPNAPRPIITISAPVTLSILTASLPVKTSPFAITGMFTAFLTSRMISQSATPAYICTLVLPCTAIAAAPASSAIFANSTAFTFPPSQPLRNFTVTGHGTFFRTSSIMRAAFSGSFISALPSPLLTIFPTGHPIFISITSAPDISYAFSADFPIHSMSLPKICAATGCSLSPSFKRSAVFPLLCSSAFALTISVYVYPAPISRHTVRKARSHTPAIGASASFVFISTFPIFIISASF